MKNTLAIMKNRAKLEQMIRNNEDYAKILEQSQKLDRYINIAMNEMKSSNKEVLTTKKER